MNNWRSAREREGGRHTHTHAHTHTHTHTITHTHTQVEVARIRDLIPSGKDCSRVVLVVSLDEDTRIRPLKYLCSKILGPLVC